LKRLHSRLTGREPSVEVLMLPHGCWRAPRGYDEVGPRLDQSLFGEREEHGCATRDPGVNELEFWFPTFMRRYLVVYRVWFVFELLGLACL
jgi:hypothetical protein